MDTLDVRLRITNLHCFEEGDFIGSAEPYLWTVFFKIDGDTTVVTPSLQLQGTATVQSRAGNQGDLPNDDVDAGENVPIPAALGEFNTRLTPIPLQQPVGDVTSVGGVVGAITVLLEKDSTSSSAVAAGHDKLNVAVRDGLNALIPTLNLRHSEPTDAEIQELTDRIGSAVTSAIADNVGIWDWIRVFGDMDDRIGSAVFRFSHNQLSKAGPDGVGFEHRFENEGDWKLEGRVSATVVGAATGSLEVTVTGVPSAVQVSPVGISGPGIHRGIKKTTTLTNLPLGSYTVTARAFTTAPNKPSCRLFTPSTGAQERTVAAGQTARVSVSFTSEPCDA